VTNRQARDRRADLRQSTPHSSRSAGVAVREPGLVPSTGREGKYHGHSRDVSRPYRGARSQSPADPQTLHELTERRGVNPPDAGQIVPLDKATGSVGNFIPISAITGVREFGFDFFNEGGPNNLKPGRPTTQTASYPPAPGFIVLRSVLSQFVTDGGTHLSGRPLGAIMVDVFFSGPGALSCTIALSDQTGDQPVKVSVRGLIVFFR